MSGSEVLDVARDAIITLVLVSAPLMLVGLLDLQVPLVVILLLQLDLHLYLLEVLPDLQLLVERLAPLSLSYRIC